MKICTSLLVTIALTSTSAMAAPPRNPCGELKNAFGPYDYREGNIDNRVALVLGAHFTQDVENNIKGSTGAIGGDLDYTLRALPNYTPALEAMVRQGQIEHRLTVSGAHWPVECYFDRAMRFRSDDPSVQTAYGSYLMNHGETERAIQMYKMAVDLKPEDATINYNVGLAYFKVKDYAKANHYAQVAYKLGFPLPGLRNLLTEAGKWDEKAE